MKCWTVQIFLHWYGVVRELKDYIIHQLNDLSGQDDPNTCT